MDYRLVFKQSDYLKHLDGVNSKIVKIGPKDFTKTIGNTSKRVAILVANYPVAFSSVIINTAVYWARNNYRVELFIDRFIFSDVCIDHPLVRVRYVTKNKPIYLNRINKDTMENGIKNAREQNNHLKKLKGLIKEYEVFILIDRFTIRIRTAIKSYYSLMNNFILPLLRYSVMTLNQMLFTKYSFVIAIEPEALIAASFICAIKRTPYYYHSLELWETNNLMQKLKKQLERHANKRAEYTFIQDEYRAGEIMASNKIPYEKIILFPVSVNGPAVNKRDRYLNDKFGIDSEKKIILYLGAIFSDVCSHEIAEQTNNLQWNSNWVLVFHGFAGNSNYINLMRKKTKPDRVIISLETVGEEELNMLVSSASVGIALYKPKDLNYKYTIFSSGKIAQYLKCGLPLIVNDYDPTKSFIDEYKCGYCIGKIDQLSSAIDAIFKNYSSYRLNAFKAFESKYNFENNYTKIFHSLGK